MRAGLAKEVRLLSGGRHKGLLGGGDALECAEGQRRSHTVDATPHWNSSHGSGGQEPTIAGFLHNQ